MSLDLANTVCLHGSLARYTTGNCYTYSVLLDLPEETTYRLSWSSQSLCFVGSPLGIFLTLRRVNPSKGRCLGGRQAVETMLGGPNRNEDGLPAAERMYNLYHPFDPVGFRLVSIFLPAAANPHGPRIMASTAA